MKKRSLKLVMSLILAMTLVMGMSISSMAAFTAPTCECTNAAHTGHYYVYYLEAPTAWVQGYNGTSPVSSFDTPISDFESHFGSCELNKWYYSSDAGSGECTGDSGQTPSSGSSSSKPAEPEKTPMEIREAIEEKLEVAPVTVDATEFNKEDATIIPGATYNLTNFITTKGIVKGINAAVEASNKAGSKTITIYSSRPFCFNETILKTIQDGKKNVTYFFKYKGHLYSVTIPATVDAAKVLEQAGFAGPFYVGQQLGTTKLVK